MKSFLEYRKLIENFLNETANIGSKEDTYKKWKSLVNMTQKELQDFYDSEDGKDSGMKQKDADKAGIDSGRESARMLLKMIPSGGSFSEAEKNWTPTMWKWASKQISFISRMSGMKKMMKGNPYERDGKLTRWYKSMLIWGHDPKK